ncbi:MAG: hypothetical protein K2N11_08375 [Mucispirillum sp.]|nr:hypothetical protein [Mucispirillum sp.]
MKKILLSLLLVFITAGLCFAASLQEAITQDLNVYNSEINPKIIDALSKIEQEMVEIDNIIEGKSKKDIKTSIKIVDNQVQAIEKHMNAQAQKIKTLEVKRYHDVTLAYIKLRNSFLKDVADVFVKKGKVDEKDKESLTKKYAGEFDRLNKENTEILKVLMETIHPAPAGNTAK